MKTAFLECGLTTLETRIRIGDQKQFKTVNSCKDIDGNMFFNFKGQ